MNKVYVIVPLILMVAFGFYYHSENQKIVAKEQREKAEKLAEEQRDKAERERQAGLAAKQAEEAAQKKAAEEAAKKEKARKEQEQQDQAVIDEMNKLGADIKDRTKELDDLKTELTNLRKQRDQVETAVFNLTRDVELARIDRRNAELELQRAVEMLADRTEASALVEVPLFPTPAPAPKSD